MTERDELGFRSAEVKQSEYPHEGASRFGRETILLNAECWRPMRLRPFRDRITTGPARLGP